MPPTRPPSWTRHAGIGVNYVAGVAGFGLFGWWLDGQWDSAPWCVLIGVALGLVGATYNLVRETMAAFNDPSKDTKAEDRQDSD